MVYTQKGEYPLALENFLSALKIRQELNQEEEVPQLVENIGIVYFRQEDYRLALQYFQQAYKSYMQQNNTASASKILVNLGATYNRLKMPAQALDANLQSLAFFEKANNLTGISIACNNVGNVYMEEKDYPKAISYYERSLGIKQKMNDKRGIAVSMKNIAEAYLGMKNLKKAKEYIDTSLKIAEEIGSKEQLKDAYDILAKMYEETRNYEEALKYEKKLSQAKDSLFSFEKTEQISRMRAIYETEKAEQETKMAQVRSQLELSQKDAAIALLNKDNEIKNAQRNFLGVSTASLLLLAMMVFYLYRQTQKSHRLLTEKNQVVEKALAEREILLKEIHHRVKNNLQIISSLLSLQSKNTQDSTAQDAISESRNRVKSMSLIHEQLYQVDTMSGVDMKPYLERLVTSLISSYGIDTERIVVTTQCDPIWLDVDSAIPLGLIINELVSNSMKYAFPENRSGEVSILLQNRGNELTLSVTDTGIGFSEAHQNGHSFGLNMIRSLMRKLKAEMTMVTTNGTKVELAIRDFRKVEIPTFSNFNSG
jgi:two-component sensor histidine kinase